MCVSDNCIYIYIYNKSITDTHTHTHTHTHTSQSGHNPLKYDQRVDHICICHCYCRGVLWRHMTLCESFQIEATRLEYRVQMTETCNGTAHAALYGRQKVLFGHLCAYGTHLFQSLAYSQSSVCGQSQIQAFFLNNRWKRRRPYMSFTADVLRKSIIMFICKSHETLIRKLTYPGKYQKNREPIFLN